MPGKPTKIDALTGLRFCAAYVVLISHILGVYSLGIDDAGGVSVQLFFTLSGFVMYLNYYHKIATRQISFKRFFLLRLVRLYPVYFLSITVYLLFLLHSMHFSQLRTFYVANLLMVQSWMGKMIYAFSPINAPSWSVSNEMFFYVAFFFIAYTLTMKKLFRYFIAYLVISILCIFYLKTKPNLISFKWVWYINPLFTLTQFMIGYFVGYLYTKCQEHKLTVTNAMNRRYAATATLAFIALFGFQFILPMDAYWYSVLITSVMSAYLIFNLAYFQGSLSRFLSTRPMVLLGESSYSLYLIHWLIIMVLLPAFVKNTVLLYITKFTVPVICSVAVYTFYEIKIYRYLKAKVQRSGRLTEQVVSSA